MTKPQLTPPERARLESCYRAAEYRVFLADRLLVLRLDQRLDCGSLRQCCPAMLLSADNPWGEPQSAAVNRAARAELKAYVRALGKRYWPGEGRDPAGVWPSEPSLFILQMHATEATALAQRFQQLAWIGIDPEAWVRLCWT